MNKKCIKIYISDISLENLRNRILQEIGQSLQNIKTKKELLQINTK